MNKYTQCLLKQGARERASWIPSCFARMNSILRFKKHGNWGSGWIVTFVGAETDKGFIPEESYSGIKDCH